LRHQTAKRLRCIGGGDASGELSLFGRKGVPESVDEELFEGGEVRASVQFGTMKQAGKLRTFDGGMHLGRAHDQFRRQLSIGRAAGPRDNPQSHIHVLRLSTP